MLVREGQYDVWARWAALVHEPARGLLLDFAEAVPGRRMRVGGYRVP